MRNSTTILASEFALQPLSAWVNPTAFDLKWIREQKENKESVGLRTPELSVYFVTLRKDDRSPDSGLVMLADQASNGPCPGRAFKGACVGS
jgi:hypothetical protein